MERVRLATLLFLLVCLTSPWFTRGRDPDRDPGDEDTRTRDNTADTNDEGGDEDEDEDENAPPRGTPSPPPSPKPSSSSSSSSKSQPTVADKVISSPVQDIHWLNDLQTIFVLTTRGHIYRSPDGGKTWQSQMERMESSLETMARGSGIRSIHINPLDNKRIFFRGVDTKHWITRDAGKKYEVVTTEFFIDEIKFHPTEPDMFLFSTTTPKCYDRTADGECTKEMYLTQSFGKNILFLANRVVQFDWGKAGSDDLPKETIYATLYEDKNARQQFGVWDPHVSFMRTTDMSSYQKILPQGNKFVFMDKFLFVAVVNENREVSLHVSTDNGNTFQVAQLPMRLLEHSYTILDTSEGSAFLHVNHGDSSSRYGNIYISDASGTKYSFSLRNNKRDLYGRCDFEKMEGLEGIYMANWIGNALEADKGTDPDLMLVRTAITFDKGGEWRYVLPPLKDYKGNKIDCNFKDENGDDDCYLHLHGTTADMGPFYSTESAIGLILANGNIGPYLYHRSDQVNVYFSRDAGLSWYEIRKGPHIYEFGDHGALIVMAPTDKATDTLYYSWNEGLTWTDLKFTDSPMEVKNIVIEPSSKSQVFLLYGQRGFDDGVLVYLDFSSLHERQCRNPDAPDSEESDYERWSPADRLEGRCLMGHQSTYTRRKRDAECFNGLDLERSSFVKNCPCAESDYECDTGYYRPKTTGECVLEDPTAYVDPREELCKKNPGGVVYVTQGYRKVAGDTCVEGVNHMPLPFHCSGGGVTWHPFLVVLLLAGLMVGVIMITRNEQCRNWIFSFQKGVRYTGLSSKPDTLSDDEFGLMDEDEDEDAEVLHDGALMMNMPPSTAAAKEAPKQPLGTLPVKHHDGNQVPTLRAPPRPLVNVEDGEEDDFNPRAADAL